jgi:hypothetical protein
MSCRFEKDGKLVDETQLLKDFTLLQDQKVDLEMSQDFFSPSQNRELKPSFKKALEYKQALRSTLRRKLDHLNAAKGRYSTDLNAMKELLALEQNVNERMEELDREIAIFSSKSATLKELEFYAETDFKRLDYILGLTQPSAEDLTEAKRIINFYMKLGKLDGSNPVIPKEMMLNAENEVILDQETIDMFTKFARRAIDAQTVIHGREQEAAEQFINDDTQVINLWEGKRVSYENAFRTEQGLKDATWMDMFVMDVTNGVFSHNGIVPQVMMRILQGSMQDKLVYSKGIEQEVDRLQPLVDKILREEFGAGFDTIFGIKGVSYDVFRAKDSDGNFMDSVVQRFSPSFYRSRSAVLNTYYQDLAKANEVKTMRGRRAKIEKAVAKRNDWFKRNTVVIDPSLIAEVQAEVSGDHNFGTPEEMAAYKEELIAVLGSEIAYKQEVSNVVKKTKEYEVAREVFIESLMAEFNLSEPADIQDFDDPKKKMHYWEQENSPFIGANQFQNKRRRRFNKALKPVPTTPKITFHPTEQETVEVFLNVRNGNIAVEDRLFINAKEGDEIILRGNSPDNVVMYKSIIGSHASKTRLSLRFDGTNWIPFQDTSMKYSYAVPRKVKQKETGTFSTGKVLEEGNVKTGFYDEAFQKIEVNETLLEFHTLLMNVQKTMVDVMPPEVRQKFKTNSLVAHKKAIFEIIADPELPIREKLFKALRELYDLIRGAFGQRPQINTSQVPIDPDTGIPEYQVNTEFMNSNQTRINELYNVEKRRAQLYNVSAISTINLTKASKEAIQLLAENLGVYANTSTEAGKQKTLQAIEKRLPSRDIKDLNYFEVLRAAITDQVVREQTFDLPKLMKLYSHLTMEYAARTEVKPVLELLKKHYDAIKQPEQNNEGELITGADGSPRLLAQRTKANAQMESWFGRAVLGNYGSKPEFGNTKLASTTVLGKTGKEQIDKFTEKLGPAITGKILTKDEKDLRRKLEELKQNASTEEELAKYQNQIDNLGKNFSVVKAFDALFNFIRLKGLGWNLSSYVTNFMEGQIANMTVAASGDYFTPENIYAANHIVKGSFIKNMTFARYAPPGSLKTRILMDRYRVLQDASNELQKASAKSSFSSFKRIAPYEGTKRTEYLNQAPLMIAIMMDIKIKGNDGSTSSVWDAMNEDGTFKDTPYDTPENNKNWVDANGQAYKDFSSKLVKTIVNAHGDYDDLRGNMASEYSTGKAFLMFKRWLSRQLYQRFATVEQTDLEAGILDFKGRYRSHTQASGMMHGAILGFAGLSLVGAGPLGLLLGGTAGLISGKVFGAKTRVPFLTDLAYTSKQMAMTMLGLPVNNVLGRSVLDAEGVDKIQDNYRFTERDAKNFRANLVDMSMMLAWTGLLLFTKALLWDDDDEEDSTRRLAHNLLANRFMQLSSQAAMYVNPSDFYENTMGSMALMRFFDDVGKLGKEASDFLEGRDQLAAGPNAGESALVNQAMKTLLPGFFQDPFTFGFGTQMSRQFQPTGFDTWFHSEYKKNHLKNQAKRAARKKELLSQGKEEKEIRKILNKELPYEKKPKKELEKK